MHLKLLNLFFVLLVTLNLTSQERYPQNYFISPVDIEIKLSGTFGELRSDHFHSGMDIRTNEVEGFNIYAIADGYVSRIKVSSGGYGNALYITHNNGFVSVYGHLQQYNQKISEFVKNEQYRRESFEVDLFPPKDLLKVTKGEIVALSGNTGRSGGPHLHFEIRNEATQKPINPLHFGYKVKDITPPVINLLKVYPANHNTLVENKNISAEFFTQNDGKEYSLVKKDTIRISGKAYFGINTYDPFNAGNNKNGVYSIKLLLDEKLIYEHDAETFSFDETRYINSLIDYKEYKLKKRRVQKSYIQPNNQLSIYGKVENKGVIKIKEGIVHELTYMVSDIAGNISQLSFFIKGKQQNIKPLLNSEKQDELFSYKTNNSFKTEDIIFEVPGKALYDDLYFEYKVSPSSKNSFSPIHHLHYDYVPLHARCNLKIRPDSLPQKLQDKALIARIGEKNKFKSAGGEWVDGFIETRIREFGKYCILVDTIPPEIKEVDIYNNKDISKQNTIKVKIEDKLAGIKSYRGTLNGKWILMEYDAKSDLLIYRYDGHLIDGNNNFELKVVDEKNNISEYKVNLGYQTH